MEAEEKECSRLPFEEKHGAPPDETYVAHPCYLENAKAEPKDQS